MFRTVWNSARLIGLLIPAALVIGAPVAEGQSGLGDFDGDGLSDLAYVRVDRAEGATSFRVRLSSVLSPLKRYRFLVAGDAFITGKWYSDGRTYPGVVKVDDLALPLRWIMKTPTGEENTTHFGLPGDLIPNQGDLDCDGRTDLIATRVSAGSRLWNILPSTGGVTREVSFGSESDHLFVGDTDGDGCDELIALNPSTFTWSSRTLAQDTMTTVQFGASGDSPLSPRDLNGDDIPDYIVVRTSGSSRNALIRFGEGNIATVPLGPSTAAPFAGNFYGSSTLGWYDWTALQATFKMPSSDSTEVFSFGTADGYLVPPDGTVVLPGDDGSVFGGGRGDASCERRLKPVDGRSRNITYNPANSRRKPKLIMPSRYRKGVLSVRLYQGSTLLANCPRALPNEHGNRPRWYCDIPVSETPKNVTFVLRWNGKTDCVRIKNPKKRYD